METFSLVSSIFSTVLSIVATILSILFYKWSDNANKETQRLASGIEGNTKKIESLFDKFYSDTFGLMKKNMEALQNKFLSEPISSGDSSQTEHEQLETVICAMMLRAKTSTKDGLHHFIESTKIVQKYKADDVNKALESLEKKGTIFIKNNVISITSNNSSGNDEGQIS